MGRCMLLLPSQCTWWAILLKGVVERMIFTYIILARTSTPTRGVLYPAFAREGCAAPSRTDLNCTDTRVAARLHPDIHGRSYGLGRYFFSLKYVVEQTTVHGAQ
jgi:hypothetical protein